MKNMDYTKSNVSQTTTSLDVYKMSKRVDNIYKMILIIAKRSNQISAQFKDELSKKLQEFVSLTDNLEEIFENKEQIEISRYYERLPKPTAIATQEFIEDKIYHRVPTPEDKLPEEEGEDYNKDVNAKQ